MASIGELAFPHRDPVPIVRLIGYCVRLGLLLELLEDLLLVLPLAEFWNLAVQARENLLKLGDND